MFWKSEREFLRQARTWTLPELDRIQPEVLAADKACKTAGSPDALIAERLALQRLHRMAGERVSDAGWLRQTYAKRGSLNDMMRLSSELWMGQTPPPYFQ